MPRPKVVRTGPTRTPWIADIVAAMTNLGGQAHFKQLYAEIKRIRTEPMTSNWKIVVRNQIDLHSSDSENYDDRKEDLFYSVHGLGRGVWALRKLIPEE